MHYQGGLEAATVVAWVEKHRVAARPKLHRARVKAYGSGEGLHSVTKNLHKSEHALQRIMK